MKKDRPPLSPGVRKAQAELRMIVADIRRIRRRARKIARRLEAAARVAPIFGIHPSDGTAYTVEAWLAEQVREETEPAGALTALAHALGRYATEDPRENLEWFLTEEANASEWRAKCRERVLSLAEEIARRVEVATEWSNLRAGLADEVKDSLRGSTRREQVERLADLEGRLDIPAGTLTASLQGAGAARYLLNPNEWRSQLHRGE